MKTKIQKFFNALPSIFGTSEVDFVKIDNESFAVRSSQNGMFCGCELRRLIKLCDELDLSFFVRSITLLDSDFCEFVIY